MPKIADTSITWTVVKRKFRVEGNRIVRASWEDDKG